MRKSLSVDSEQHVIELYVSGDSVREINKKTGISTGSISNIIKKFSEKLQNHDFHVMHEFYKIQKKLNLNPNDAFNGFAIFSTLSKNNMECSSEFVESVLVYGKKNNLTPDHLIDLCEQLSNIQSSSNISLDEIKDYCNDLVEKKNTLESNVSELQNQYDESKKSLNASLQERQITLKQLTTLDGTIQFLKKNGIQFDEFDSIYNMLKNTKKQNYDIKEIVGLLAQNKSINKLISQKESELNNLLEALEAATKQEKQMSLLCENLQLRHKTMKDSIKSVENLLKQGVKIESIPVWSKILDLAGMTADEFENNLRKSCSMEIMIKAQEMEKAKLGGDIVLIQKKKTSLEKKSNKLKLEITNWTKYGQHKLNEITRQSESEIKKTVENSEKQIFRLVQTNKEQSETLLKDTTDYFADIMQELSNVLEKSHKMEHTLGEMKSLKPLFDLIRSKFDPASSITQIIIILDLLNINIKDTELDKYFLSSEINRLREKLMDVISRGR